MPKPPPVTVTNIDGGMRIRFISARAISRVTKLVLPLYIYSHGRRAVMAKHMLNNVITGRQPESVAANKKPTKIMSVLTQQK